MKTTIKGITVEMEQYDDSSNCYLSYKNYSCSLALAEDLGGIEDSDTGEVYKIPHTTMKQITTWANGQGY